MRARSIKLEDFAPRHKRSLINWPVLFGWLGALAMTAAFWLLIWSWAGSSLRAAYRLGEKVVQR